MFTLYFSLLSVQYYVYKQNIHILIKNTLLLKNAVYHLSFPEIIIFDTIVKRVLFLNFNFRLAISTLDVASVNQIKTLRNEYDKKSKTCTPKLQTLLKEIKDLNHSKNKQDHGSEKKNVDKMQCLSN